MSSGAQTRGGERAARSDASALCAPRTASPAGPRGESGDEGSLTLAGLLRAALVSALGFFYLAAAWYGPAQRWPGYRTIHRVTQRFLLLHVPLSMAMSWALKGWAFALLPVLVHFALRQPLGALGLTRGARQGWRLAGLAFALALPAMVAVGLQGSIARYYSHMFVPGGWVTIAAHALVITSEHAVIFGVFLAYGLPGGRLHGANVEREGRLAAFGLGHPAGGQRGLLSWLGLPAAVWPALVLQALTFGLLHTSKVSAEMIAAFPGGLGLAALTYRAGAVWPGVALHLGSGAVILAVARAGSG